MLVYLVLQPVAGLYYLAGSLPASTTTFKVYFVGSDLQ